MHLCWAAQPTLEYILPFLCVKVPSCFFCLLPAHPESLLCSEVKYSSFTWAEFSEQPLQLLQLEAWNPGPCSTATDVIVWLGRTFTLEGLPQEIGDIGSGACSIPVEDCSMQPLPSLLRSVLGFKAPLKIQGLNLSVILKKVSICGLRILIGDGPCILFRRERVTPRWCGSRGRKTLKWCGHKPRSPIYHQKQGNGPLHRPAQEQISSKIDTEFLASQTSDGCVPVSSDFRLVFICCHP